MRSCSFLGQPPREGQDAEGQRAEMEEQWIIIIKQDFAHADPLAQILPALHATSSTKPSPSCSNQSSTNLLDYNRRLFYGPPTLLAPHIDTFNTMSYSSSH